MDDAVDDRYNSSAPVSTKRVLCSTAFWILLLVLLTMAGVTLILFALGMLGVSEVREAQAAQIKVQVYYESLCPDSRRFINNQLYPTIQLLGGVNNEYMETELIPYGKANTTFDGSFEFVCQHGNQECEGNKVHACALQKLSAAEGAAFVNCSMALFNSPISDPDCAQSLNLDWTNVESCLNTWEASTLLAANGIKTHDLRPTLYYVPWIVINGVFTPEDLDLAQRDLIGLVCDRLNPNITLPSQCSESHKGHGSIDVYVSS